MRHEVLHAWVEDRRQIVDRATGGKVGYINVQSTGTDAQNEPMRQFMAQWNKESYWAVRDGHS